MHFDRAGAAAMTERELSLFAYRTRCAVLHILATTPPNEAPDRVEDIIHGAFCKIETDTRRAVHREYSTEN
jgi:hypothetical protein